MTNRLSESTSPYLLQHAHQPVHWWPWGDEAFAEARERDLPIFLSVGYAACHWCHVMAHESFDDAEMAAFMNEHFINIKVDREEHPDVDAVHMFATQALTGRGGWPMSVFLTPEGDAFFAGTYFPPEPSQGMASFRQVCEALAEAWTTRRDEVLESASTLRSELAKLSAPQPSESAAPKIREMQEALTAQFDVIHGGFGNAPKFPPAMVLDALLVKGDPQSLGMAQETLERMAKGGIHDQLVGGFHRYTVDAGWVVPHFEKMLYDNALLLGGYARGWRRTADHDPDKRALFEHVVYGIVDWLKSEMRTDHGGFASSLDADSVDIRGAVHEGIFYVWSPELLIDALGEQDGQYAADVFHVTTTGTFEHGFSTLQLRGRPDWPRLEKIIGVLKAVRAERFRPARDDKVVAAWNGLLIDSLVTAALIFGELEWLELAREAADNLWTVHKTEDGLRRASLGGVPSSAPAVTEDYAAMALGFARLAGALGDSVWLERAQWLLDEALERFSAEDGGFYDAEANPLLSRRPRDLTDNATPSATSTMISALRLVGLMSERADYGERADAAAKTLWATVTQSPRFAGWALADVMIADEARRGLKLATVIVVEPEGERFSRLNQAAWRMAPAGSAIITGTEGTTGFGDLFVDRTARDGAATAYVCRGQVCFEPTSDYLELKTPLWSRC